MIATIPSDTNTTEQVAVTAGWILIGGAAAFVALAFWAWAALEATVIREAERWQPAQHKPTQQEITDAKWRPGLRPTQKKGAPDGRKNRAAGPSARTYEEKTTLPSTAGHQIMARTWWKNGDES